MSLPDVTTTISPLERVTVLAEALPYLQEFAGKTIVIKYGGAAMKVITYPPQACDAYVALSRLWLELF